MKYFIAVLIFLSVIGFTYAEEPKPLPIVITVVEIVDTTENQNMFKMYGYVVAKPLPHPQGIYELGKTGAICDVFDHKYKNAVCEICGKSMTSVKK